MIPAVAQPAFLQAFRPAVHTLRARDPDGSHASRPLSRLLRRGFADVLLICPDTPPAFTARPAQMRVVFPLFYDSHTSSQCGRGPHPRS